MYAHGIGNIKKLQCRKKAAAEIAEKAKELSVSLIVVGKPVNMDGSLGEKAQSAMAFADMIGGLCDIPVTLYDERCTTVMAHMYLRESGIKTKKSPCHSRFTRGADNPAGLYGHDEKN